MPNTTVRAAATGLPAVLIQADFANLRNSAANSPASPRRESEAGLPRFGDTHRGAANLDAIVIRAVPLKSEGNSPRVFPDFSRPAAVDPVETERAMNAVLEAINAILAAEGGAYEADQIESPKLGAGSPAAEDVADMSLWDFPILSENPTVSPTTAVQS